MSVAGNDVMRGDPTTRLACRKHTHRKQPRAMRSSWGPERGNELSFTTSIVIIVYTEELTAGNSIDTSYTLV